MPPKGVRLINCAAGVARQMSRVSRGRRNLTRDYGARLLLNADWKLAAVLDLGWRAPAGVVAAS